LVRTGEALKARWLTVLCTTEFEVAAETDRLEYPRRSSALTSWESFEGSRRELGMLTSFRLLSLSMLLLSFEELVGFLVPRLRRGIRLPLAFPFGGFVVFLVVSSEATWAGGDASDGGCETQSSDKESSQACVMPKECGQWNGEGCGGFERDY
jgi:hypothetical protein